MQKTDWFSANTPPLRRGWYEVRGVFIDSTRGSGGVAMRYWNGRRWLWTRGSGGVAMRYWNGRRWLWKSTITGKKTHAAVGGSDKWRGLVMPNGKTPNV